MGRLVNEGWGYVWRLPLGEEIFAFTKLFVSQVTAVHGVPGLVVAMKLFGYNSGRPRSPLQSLNDEDARNVRQAFEENGFL